jgi:hypothetical protein
MLRVDALSSSHLQLDVRQIAEWQPHTQLLKRACKHVMTATCTDVA